jgi:hypothetical protein
VIYWLSVRAAADQDLADVFTWYESQEPGTGERFMQEVDRALMAIEERPLSFPLVRSRTRRCVLSDFSYSIYFVIIRRRIFVTACVHQNRHPRVWRSRK